jgi:hypothetical protein
MQFHAATPGALVAIKAAAACQEGRGSSRQESKDSSCSSRGPSHQQASIQSCSSFKGLLLTAVPPPGCLGRPLAKLGCKRRLVMRNFEMVHVTVFHLPRLTRKTPKHFYSSTKTPAVSSCRKCGSELTLGYWIDPTRRRCIQQSVTLLTLQPRPAGH